MFKKKNKIVEKHKYTVIEECKPPKEEIYPETNMKMIRPDIKWKRVVLNVILHLAGICILAFPALKGVSFFSWYDNIDLSYGVSYILCCFFTSLVCILFRMKKIIIFFIRVYQKYAPYEIRFRCLFVPNCSEYMVMAIEKYGIIKGVKKGVDRLKRCHDPNGGEDYP